MLSELPYYNLTDEQFAKEIGAWVYNSIDNLYARSKDLFKDIVESPDKANDFNENLIYDSIESKYHTIKQFGNRFSNVKHKGFSILHCNIRSLPKNLSLLNDVLLMVKELPNIIAITETRLAEDSHHNIRIPGYIFLGVNSKTSAGGVGIYISENINFTRRNYLDLALTEGVENCWIEIQRTKQKNVVIGCIYRHPSQNRETFHEAIETKLNLLTDENCEVYIAGDINIDFLKYHTDNKTSDYLDMLLNLGFLPIITKATRITDHTATLIDHIYTNCPQKVVKSGVCLVGISDHLPVFCTIENKLPFIQERKYYRDFSKFNNELFIDDLNKINFNNFVSTDVNQSMNGITNALKEVTNKHAPIRKTSNAQQRLLKKPWLSNTVISKGPFWPLKWGQNFDPETAPF